MKRKSWLWALAVLPLIGVPLIAQQANPDETPPQVEAPAAQPAESPPVGDTPEPASSEPAVPADERLSVDNSLSFPVDI